MRGVTALGPRVPSFLRCKAQLSAAPAFHSRLSSFAPVVDLNGQLNIHPSVLQPSTGDELVTAPQAAYDGSGNDFTRKDNSLEFLSTEPNGSGFGMSQPQAVHDQNHDAAELVQAVVEYQPRSGLHGQTHPDDKDILASAIKVLALSKRTTESLNREHHLPEHLYSQLVSKFRRRLNASPGSIFSPEQGGLDGFRDFLRLAHAALTGPPSAMPIFLTACVPLLAHLARELYRDQLSAAAVMRQATDLREPHTWYPQARAMKRRVIFHAGATNSGKTYHALRALRDAHSGVYCGPLRLLALEVYESLNCDGVEASLATGQERKELPFAKHRSCTIEMVDTRTRVDVAVIDEIQMIGDPQRGSSWTRALLGIPAPEVHVCGDPAAIPVVTAVLAACGDTLEIREYTRLSQLEVSGASLGNDYGQVRPGDCVVAFSRKDIYAIRRTIERKTAHKCCVVYGSLPPETRSQQARMFNDPGSGYDVLVASDAIGMGLNLNIRRVVFHTMDKFNGESVGPVAPAQVKQIAGRAGRHGSIYPQGFATALGDDDLPYLRQCWEAPSPPITAAGLFPNVEQLAALAAHMPPNTELAKLVDHFVAASQLDGPFFMCRADDIKLAANLIQPFPLSLPQRCALTLAPVNLRNSDARSFFLRYLEAYVSGHPVRLDLQLPYDDPAYLARDLEVLEVKHHALDIYLWLCQRLGPGSFPDMTSALAMRAKATDMLERALTTLSDETKGDWERELAVRRARHSRKESAMREAALRGGGSGRGGEPGQPPQARDRNEARLGRTRHQHAADFGGGARDGRLPSAAPSPHVVRSFGDSDEPAAVSEPRSAPTPASTDGGSRRPYRGNSSGASSSDFSGHTSSSASSSSDSDREAVKAPGHARRDAHSSRPSHSHAGNSSARHPRRDGERRGANEGRSHESRGQDHRRDQSRGRNETKSGNVLAALATRASGTAPVAPANDAHMSASLDSLLAGLTQSQSLFEGKASSAGSPSPASAPAPGAPGKPSGGGASARNRGRSKSGPSAKKITEASLGSVVLPPTAHSNMADAGGLQVAM